MRTCATLGFIKPGTGTQKKFHIPDTHNWAGFNRSGKDGLDMRYQDLKLSFHESLDALDVGEYKTERHQIVKRFLWLDNRVYTG